MPCTHADLHVHCRACALVISDISAPFFYGLGANPSPACFLCTQVRISGPAASVMTVRVAVTQKLREKIPTIAAVQLL